MARRMLRQLGYEYLQRLIGNELIQKVPSPTLSGLGVAVTDSYL